jgi:hypothetical protein
MQTSTLFIEKFPINTRFSLRPLIESLKNIIASGKPGADKLYAGLMQELESYPELMEPISDPSILEKNKGLVDALIATIFPPTKINSQSLYSVAIPFTFETVYTSRYFKQLFLIPGTNTINVPDNELGRRLERDKLNGLYELILKKFVNHDFSDLISTVYPFANPVTGLTSFLELQLDTRFVDVKARGEIPEFPAHVINKQTNRLMPVDEFFEQVPPDLFEVEGLIIVRVNDVTETEIISQIKNLLLKINAFSENAVYEQLQAYIQSLLNMKDIKIGITPFLQVNDHYVYSESHSNNSLLFKNITTNAEKDELVDTYRLFFRDVYWPLVFEDLEADIRNYEQQLGCYFKEGCRSLIICPLKTHNELLGVLEIVSNEAGKLNRTHIAKIESAIPLFALAIEKSAENLDGQIDKVIKQQFTAIQPAVEWNFTDKALNYIIKKQDDLDAKIEKISFPDVFPLYGAIDIRNSSIERSHSIQLDLVHQLELASTVIKKAQADMPFPLLQEIEFKINKFISAASDVLMSDEEIGIHDFMHGQVTSIFNHLHSTQPSLKNEIERYFAALDPQTGMVYHHRKDYEQSIGQINDTLARLIEKEQVTAQKVYPHYFERYVTDGVEFNIYLGQSIAPRKKFDELYLRNMKMWQLSLMAKAARATFELESKLSHPLRTTQLILAHSIPLSISFRIEERKFDVDGDYNIRYEIIKKRIDKVRIKETNERLTQPGKIAIVYSQSKDASEYSEYIEFLQNQNLLRPTIEKHELEELQGVVGLKALRVEVNFDNLVTRNDKIELSETTTQQLIGK